jgi:uncharacterized protein (DUF433 family)
MSVALHTDGPPIRRDEDGVLRVGQSRVLIDLVIQAFQDGATAETIVQRYPSATLADVYATIAYYLKHQVEIDEYLKSREEQAAEIRKKIDGAQPDLAHLRARLLAKRAG